MKTFSRIIGVPGLANLGVVAMTEERLSPMGAGGRVYRSAQPELYEAPPQYLDVKVVLCLRDDSDQQMADRSAEVIQAGMRYIPFRVNVFSDVTPDDLDLIVRVMADPANQPLLVHCLQGQDRTGVICAAYRLRVDRWSLAEAQEEMDAYGSCPFWWEMKKAVERYAKSIKSQ